MFKKVLYGFIATSAVLAGGLNVYASPAAEEFAVNNYEEGLIIDMYNVAGGPTDKDLIIPDELYDLPVVAIGEFSFAAMGLTSAVVPESVRSIGSYSFLSNPELTSVTVLNESAVFGTEVFNSVEYDMYVREDFVLRGISGSTTEAYALQNGVTFEALGAQSIKANVDVIAGSLAFENETVGVTADSITLNGRSQVLNALFANSVDIVDARGSHDGYDVQVSVSDLVSGENVITKDNVVFKNLQSTSLDGITGPIGDVSGASSFSLMNLLDGRGIGRHTVDFSNSALDITISEKTKAGLYNGTITFALVTSP